MITKQAHLGTDRATDSTLKRLLAGVYFLVLPKCLRRHEGHIALVTLEASHDDCRVLVGVFQCMTHHRFSVRKSEKVSFPEQNSELTLVRSVASNNLLLRC